MKITIGNLIDQLSIVNIKIFMLEDIKRDNKSNDIIVADATRRTNILNVQRNSLIEAIDIEINEIAAGKKQKLFGSNKMYGKE